MALQCWYMSWYPDSHTVKILYSKRGKSCAAAALRLCNTQQDALLVTLIPLKERSSWDREVDLDTTYKKGGKNPRKGTPFLRLKLFYILIVS